MENICFHRIIDNGRKPTPEQCQEGQLILQLAEKKIYTKDHTGKIISIGGGDSGVPVGGIVAFPKLPVPHNFRVCDGGKFDKNIFTALYEYLGKDTVPDFTDRYLKHIGKDLSPLTTMSWMIPEHTHNVSGSGKTRQFDYGTKATSKSGKHNHSFRRPRGDQNYKNGGGNTWWGPSNNTTVTTSTTGEHSHQVYIGAHQHDFNFSALSGGIHEGINKGSSLEVDHIGVVYAIKAYDSIDEPEQLTAQNVVNQLTTFFNKVDVEKSDHAKLVVSAEANKDAELWLTEDNKHGFFIRHNGAGNNYVEFGTKGYDLSEVKFMSVSRGEQKVSFAVTPNVGPYEMYHAGNKPAPHSIGAVSIEEYRQRELPVGIPFPWPKTQIPSGYLECRGQTFDKSQFTALAAAYPSGRLPDMRDQVIKGHGSGRAPLSRQGARNPLSRIETSYPRNSATNQSFGTPQSGWSGWFYGGGGSGPGNSIRLHSVEPYVRSVSFVYIVKAA